MIYEHVRVDDTQMVQGGGYPKPRQLEHDIVATPVMFDEIV